MIGFIGTGNMANAIIKGMLASGMAVGADIMVCDIDSRKTAAAARNYGVCVAADAREIAGGCDNVVLSVKPHDFKGMLATLDKTLIEHDPLLISVAAGNSIEFIASCLSYNPAVARVMPNINAAIGEAMSAYCVNERVTAEQKAFTAQLCSSIGESVELDEKMFSAFGVIAGCAPAFAYIFIDELARAGVKIGVNKAVALKIAAQTVLGSAKMVAQSAEHPYELADRVCSAGGTTIEGVAALNEHGFSNAVMQAVSAAYKKDKSLSGSE